MFTLNGDPQINPFNEWLSQSGIYVAISVAGILLITVVTILIINKSKKK